MGNSGIGKTTLLKFLIGQLKAPKQSLYYLGKDLANYSDEEIQEYRQHIGVIFQDYKLLESKNVEDNIRLPLDIQQKYDTLTLQKKLDEALALVQMKEKRKEKIQTLSGGEKQRVAIARALIHDPYFLIADEATGNLDRKNSYITMDKLLEIHQKGNTILCITHDEQLVAYCKNKNPAVKLVELT
jgi:cell division transport system ATP-binding protein